MILWLELVVEIKFIYNTYDTNTMYMYENTEIYIFVLKYALNALSISKRHKFIKN